MLEPCVNQAAGLQSIALQTAPRVIAMASHGSQQGELPLLWCLCSTLVSMGYPVAVLDATTVESTDNPGLAQLLDDADWPDDEGGGALSWAVIPAALGLEQLGSRPSQQGLGLALDPLSGLLQNFGVIVIYANADLLTRLLPGSGIEPLLTLAPVSKSSVTAYEALKKLLIKAQLCPTVATIMGEFSSSKAMTQHSTVKNLQVCAQTFLNYRLDSLAVRTQQPTAGLADDINRLALRLLERAMPLHRHHFVGNH
jgi:hypothetical protein